MRPKIYITRQLPQIAIDILLKQCNVSMWDSQEAVPKGELLNNVSGVQGILCTATDKIDHEVLDAAGTNLIVVATMSKDCSHIDTVECSNRGIRLATVPETMADDVADQIVTQLQMAAQCWMKGLLSINEKDNQIIDVSNLEEELSTKTLGILGFGKVGLAVAKKVQQLGVGKIIYNDLGPVATAFEAEFVPFTQMLEQSDIVCVCCKLTTKTKHIFRKESFRKMKQSAILINASRGEVVNYIDLYETLRNGSITAAVLGVREHETIPYKHPLSGLRNCFFSPYRECNQKDARGKTSVAAANNIMCALAEKVASMNGLVNRGPSER